MIRPFGSVAAVVATDDLALKSGKGPEASEIKGGHTIPLTIIKIVTKDLYKFFEKLLNCCYFVKELLLKLLEKLSELIEFFEKINLINGHPLVVWPCNRVQIGVIGPKMGS
jgi:hypothetical protein